MPVDLYELEARRQAWREHGDGPGHWRRVCAYKPCSSVFFSKRSDAAYCTRRCYLNNRNLAPTKLCGFCRTEFAPIVHVKFNGRWVSKEKIWCSESCRKKAWAWKQRHNGVYKGFSTWKFPHVKQRTLKLSPTERAKIKPPRRKPAGKLRGIYRF